MQPPNVDAAEPVHIHGRSYGRSELIDLTGDIDQLGGVIASTLSDGPSAGVRIMTVRSPGGLSFVCMPDRGLDIGWADWAGMPLAWRSPVGDVGAPFAEPAGRGWLRTFGGGLLTTCGLSTVGQPSLHNGEAFGLHGRYSATPARQVAWSVDWVDDERVATITGRVREASALGPVLELHRTITTILGSGQLRVDDVVTNLGATPTPHMFRYHVNLGFPLVDEHSRVSTPLATVAPLDSKAVNDSSVWDRIGPPLRSAPEQIFVVDRSVTEAGAAVLQNDGPRPSLQIRWSVDTLQQLVVWRQSSAGTYVTALEPSDCDDRGRAAASAAGTLRELQPGQQVSHWLEVSILKPQDRHALQSAASTARHPEQLANDIRRDQGGTTHA